MKINNPSRQNKVYAYSLKKEHSIKISTKQKKRKNHNVLTEDVNKILFSAPNNKRI